MRLQPPHERDAGAAERVEDLDWLLARIAHDDPYVERFDVFVPGRDRPP